MKFNIIKSLFVVIVGLLFASNIFAASSPVVLGQDYTVITSPVPKSKEPNGKVNVKLFFSFTCIHCKDVEPLMEAKLLPNKAVDLQRIHVAWDPTTENYAKLNATYVLMNLNKLYGPSFTATFAHQNLNDIATLKSFLKQNGLTVDQINKFMDNYTSFTVSSKVSEYKNLMSVYNIEGTPTFVVADTYMVKPALPDRLIEVVTYLVNKAASGK